jgi:hypothetical protein
MTMRDAGSAHAAWVDTEFNDPSVGDLIRVEQPDIILDANDRIEFQFNAGDGAACDSGANPYFQVNLIGRWL